MNVKHLIVCVVESIDKDKKVVQISSYSFDGEQFFEDIFPGTISPGTIFPETFFPHGENFMEIFTTLCVVIWFPAGTLGFFATLINVFTMRVVIYDTLSMAIIPTLSTSILFCKLYYV